ncbi:MAG: FAD-binding protein, partial [Clostridia bacterium]|nr:FAD-binding protein [Clostridia bacterium]
KANRGVILATGGFEWNEEYVKNYLRFPMPIGAAISWPENTGDAIEMALSVGADLTLMNHAFGMPFFTAHAEYARENNVMASMAGNAARQSAGSIIVDANGRRFVQENVSYMSVVNAFGGFNNFGDHAYTADPAWWICDQASYDAQGGPTGIVKSWGFPDPGLPEEDYVFKADTPRELAEMIGINADQFVKTLEEYNVYAAEGKDPLFHRGEAENNMGQPVSPVVPIETGPYYAVAISAGVVGTIGGPKVNGNAQVMHVSDVPIAGLYAMGNCAGVGGPGPSYGGEGGTIGPAFTFGVIAAQHAAQRTDVTDTDFFINTRPNEGASAASGIQLADNEFVGTGLGIDGEVVVKITVEDGKMTNVEVLEHNETPGIGDRAVAQLPEAIVTAQSTDVETVSGATMTSKAILDAVDEALAQAGI